MTYSNQSKLKVSSNNFYLGDSQKYPWLLYRHLKRKNKNEEGVGVEGGRFFFKKSTKIFSLEHFANQHNVQGSEKEW